MLIVHTADWHLGRSINDYSLLEDQEYYLEKFIDRMKELSPDAMIIAGDIYDRSIPQAAAVSLLNKTISQLVLKMGIKVLMIAGNHDSKERLSFGNELLEQTGLYISGKIEREIKKVSIEEVDFYLLPYVEPHNVKLFFPDEEIKTHNDAVRIYTRQMRENLDLSRINILVGHGLYGGGDSSEASVGGSEMIDASLFSQFDYVALGHLHSKRTAGSPNMMFSGSPLKYSIDEWRQEKGYIVANATNKAEIEIHEESIEPLRDVEVIQVSFDEAIKGGSNNYVFFELTDKYIVLNAISRLKAVYPFTLGLKYIALAEAENAPEIGTAKKEKEMSLSEKFCGFYEMVMKESPTQEEKQYIEQTAAECRLEEER